MESIKQMFSFRLWVHTGNQRLQNNQNGNIEETEEVINEFERNTQNLGELSLNQQAEDLKCFMQWRRSTGFR